MHNLFRYGLYRHLIGGYEKSDWRRAASIVPADLDNSVLLFAHPAIKYPYWLRHHTVFWEGKVESLPLDNSRNFWLLFPKYKCGADEISKVHDFLITHGYLLVDQGSFSRDAFEIVDFKRYQSGGSAPPHVETFKGCITRRGSVKL